MRDTLGSIKAAAWRRKERLRELVRRPEARTALRRAWFLRLAGRFIEIVETTDTRGNRYFVRTTDPFIGRDLFVNGAFDEHNVEGAISTLNSLGFAPRVLIDVGANIGPTTIAILSRLPEARGFAIEPAPENFRLLEHNVLGNALGDRTVLVQAAASAVHMDLVLSLSPENPGDHQIGEVENRETTVVPGIPVDELVREHNIPGGPTTLLWMDVQGFEGDVILGASDLLSSGCSVAMEFWPATLRRKGGLDVVLALIGSSRYNIYELAVEGPRPIHSSHAVLDCAELRGGATDLLLVCRK